MWRNSLRGTAAVESGRPDTKVCSLFIQLPDTKVCSLCIQLLIILNAWRSGGMGSQLVNFRPIGGTEWRLTGFLFELYY